MPLSPTSIPLPPSPSPYPTTASQGTISLSRFPLPPFPSYTTPNHPDRPASPLSPTPPNLNPIVDPNSPASDPIHRALLPSRGRKTPKLINGPRLSWPSTNGLLEADSNSSSPSLVPTPTLVPAPVLPPVLQHSHAILGLRPHQDTGSRRGSGGWGSASPPPHISPVFERQIRSVPFAISPITEASRLSDASHFSKASRRSDLSHLSQASRLSDTSRFSAASAPPSPSHLSGSSFLLAPSLASAPEGEYEGILGGGEAGVEAFERVGGGEVRVVDVRHDVQSEDEEGGNKGEEDVQTTGAGDGDGDGGERLGEEKEKKEKVIKGCGLSHVLTRFRHRVQKLFCVQRRG